MTIDIYTDGGYFHKQDIGGWGCVIYENSEEICRDSGWKKQTSSLEMELFAAHQALLKLNHFSDNHHIENQTLQINIHTDSRIIIEGLKEKYQTWCANNWKVKSGKTVVYKELWQTLSGLSQQLNVDWKWVKGHNGNKGNTLADQLARDAVEQRS